MTIDDYSHDPIKDIESPASLFMSDSPLITANEGGDEPTSKHHLARREQEYWWWWGRFSTPPHMASLNTMVPSSIPMFSTMAPFSAPTGRPTLTLTLASTTLPPSGQPSSRPSLNPSDIPSWVPSTGPTLTSGVSSSMMTPSDGPSRTPSYGPTFTTLSSVNPSSPISTSWSSTIPSPSPSEIQTISPELSSSPSSSSWEQTLAAVRGNVAAPQSNSSSATSGRKGALILALLLATILFVVFSFISIRSWRKRHQKQKRRRRSRFFSELSDDDDSSLDEDQEQPPFAVQRRPCIVRPMTLSPEKPKVRFYLNDRSTENAADAEAERQELFYDHDDIFQSLSFSSSFEQDDDEDDDDPLLDNDEAATRCFVQSNALDGNRRYVVPHFGTSCNNGLGRHGETLGMPPSPPTQDSLFTKSSAESSLSSAILNSLDDEDDSRMGAAPKWMSPAKKNAQFSNTLNERDDTCYNTVLPIVKSGLSSSCTMNKCGCNEQKRFGRQLLLRSITSSPPPPSSISSSRPFKLFEDEYPSLLGILPSQLEHSSMEEEDDDGVEIIEFFREEDGRSGEKKWFEMV